MELERNQSRFLRSMPIRPYLDGHKFDGETIRQMGIAFELALASLRDPPDFDDPIRAALAQRIIALAKAGERDAERLCERALQAVRPAGLAGGAALRRAAKPPKPERRRSLIATMERENSVRAVLASTRGRPLA